MAHVFGDGLNEVGLEHGYKCGACGYKFFAGMTLVVNGANFCPSCKEEILKFPTLNDIKQHDYIAHTGRDRFHSIVTVEGEE
ncbi:MAG: hypothetical protein PHT60_11635 [Acidiphilium sp.]|nr:hypothetical protein [Acidiphilium sp.]MDD4936414.1 hypothetical protein [Acidiphilium sp.]